MFVSGSVNVWSFCMSSVDLSKLSCPGSWSWIQRIAVDDWFQLKVLLIGRFLYTWIQRCCCFITLWADSLLVLRGSFCWNKQFLLGCYYADEPNFFLWNFRQPRWEVGLIEEAMIEMDSDVPRAPRHPKILGANWNRESESLATVPKIWRPFIPFRAPIFFAKGFLCAAVVAPWHSMLEKRVKTTGSSFPVRVQDAPIDFGSLKSPLRWVLLEKITMFFRVFVTPVFSSTSSLENYRIFSRELFFAHLIKDIHSLS